ncbi:MAG: hypothetical protein LBQ67_05905 [Treponema sp.]|jgi:opacity protein-like surface antigen|nr:hypothetical protein [Treponema sp.]
MPYFGGGYLFFDATYVELLLGFFGGSGKFKYTHEQTGQATQSAEYDVSLASINIGLLGKYPFALTSKLTLFPLLGIDYQITVSAKLDSSEGDDPAPGDFSALWFKAGGGVDYTITSNLYVRLEALYGIWLENKAEKDGKNELRQSTNLPVTPDYDVTARNLFGHGLTVKLAVGYRFY